MNCSGGDQAAANVVRHNHDDQPQELKGEIRTLAHVLNQLVVLTQR